MPHFLLNTQFSWGLLKLRLSLLNILKGGFFQKVCCIFQISKIRRAHNSSPHKWYCHFWDWHNWYLTLLIKLKLILVNFGTLNYWYWAQFTLTLLKFDIPDLQNDWHLQLLIFGIIGISCFWFLELFIFSMCDMKHDWYMTWLTLAYLIFGISGIEHCQKLGVTVIICHWYMMP